MKPSITAGGYPSWVIAFLFAACLGLPIYGKDAVDTPSASAEGVTAATGTGQQADRSAQPGDNAGREFAASDDDWVFHLKPYVWIPSMKADSTVNGLSAGIELGVDDVLDHLTFTMMGSMEAWKDKWGLTFDGVFMSLNAEKSFQGRSGLTHFNLDADVRIGMADFGLAYRLLERQFGDDNEQCLKVEPYGGLRYDYLKQELDFNVNIAGHGSIGDTLGKSEEWVEPFIGSRLIWDLNDKLSLFVRGDAGGFGIGSASDLTWQVLGGIDYKLSKNMTLNAGYRYVDFDYMQGSGRDEFGVRLKAQGPYFGLTILF